MKIGHLALLIGVVPLLSAGLINWTKQATQALELSQSSDEQWDQYSIVDLSNFKEVKGYVE